MFDYKRHILKRNARRYFKYLKALGRSRDVNKSVFFVTGVGRSGSNMLMELLDNSLDIEVFHETDPRAFSDYLLRDDATLSALVRNHCLNFIVFKAMTETMSIRSLLDRHEKAGALWIYRNYPDQVNSFTKLWPTHGQHVKMLLDTDDRRDWRVRNLSSDSRALVQELYEHDLSEHESNAIFWLYRNKSYFDQGLNENPKVRLVKYEDLVSNPDRSGREILSFIGAEYNSKLTAHINSRSINKAPEERYRASIRVACDQLLERLDETYERQLRDS